MMKHSKLLERSCPMCVKERVMSCDLRRGFLTIVWGEDGVKYWACNY
jgi:hypothetical protein